MAESRLQRRDSNMELLRVVAMLMIVCSHFATHGAWDRSNLNIASEITLGVLQIGGEVGVNCFILISGYYLINSHFRLISVVRTWGQTLFYSIAVLAMVALWYEIPEISLIIRSFIPVLSSFYWFVTSYISLILLTPVLRRVTAGLNERGWRSLLLLLFVTMSFIPTLTTFDFAFTRLGWFCFVFLVGGYVRLYPDSKFSPYAARLVVGNAAIIVCSIAAITFLSVRWPGLLVHKAYFAEMNIVFEFALSLGVFLLFKDYDFGSQRIINSFASHAFSVYLITDNPLMRQLIWAPFSSVYSKSPALIVFVCVSSAVVLYCVCTSIDMLRSAFLEPSIVKFFTAGRIPRLYTLLESMFRSIEERDGCA